jgi:hypothetical protein
MEEILIQRMNFAKISLFKDYCKIDEGKGRNTFSDEIDFFSYSHDPIDRRNNLGIIVELPQKQGNRKTKFFYDNSPVQERFSLKYAYKEKRHGLTTYVTTKDRHIKNHYANPFSSISIDIIERSVVRFGDKLRIKLYHQVKSRSFNSIYFKKTSTIESITFNLSTGNFTIMSVTSKGKKGGTKRFVTNSFKQLRNITEHSELFNLKNSIDVKGNSVQSEYEKTFSNDELRQKIYEQLGCLDDSIKIYDLIVKKFIEIKKIKVSNDYDAMLNYLYPTEKYLKKNERKLIASILDMLQIKTKFLIKVMHVYPQFDILSVAIVCYILGDNYSKYIATIDTKWFKESRLELDVVTSFEKLYFAKTQKDKFSNDYNFTDSDKEKLIKIINSGNSGGLTLLNKMFIRDFIDHFKMIEKLKPYDPTICMKARNYHEFANEHQEFSKMVSVIKKGWSIEYKFADKMVDDVEKPVGVKIDMTDYDSDGQPKGSLSYDKFTFFPYILKRDEDYIEEGEFMHHCVASYSDKERSIIVSIRNDDASNRVTCEFDCQTGKLIQARHFCNRVPPPELELAVYEIEKKALHYARFGILHALDKRKVPIKINGIEIREVDREPTRYGQYQFGPPLPF